MTEKNLFYILQNRTFDKNDHEIIVTKTVTHQPVFNNKITVNILFLPGIFSLLFAVTY